jgi:hypothetical protein
VNLATVRETLRSKGIVRDEPGEFYPRWLRARPSAAGPDGISTSSWFMETSYEDRLAQAERWLVEPVHTRAAYTEIAKPGGGTRGIATFDRAYQAALYAVLEVVGQVIESRYTDAVVGYRAGVRLDETVIELMTLCRTAMPVLFVCDVYHCFDELDLGHLDRQIDTLVELDTDLREWLKAHSRTELVAPDGSVVAPAARTKGIAQGSVLAPLLCNLYLLPFDVKVKKRVGPATLVRYADNIATPGPDLATCKRAQTIVEEELARVRVQTKPGSARLCDVNNPKNPCSFLGIAWTKQGAWADPEAVGKKIEMLRQDIQLGRKGFIAVEEYLDGLKRYFQSVLSGEAAENVVQQIEELLGAELLRAVKGGKTIKNQNGLYALREQQRAHHVQEGQPTRMITRTSIQPSGPTGGTNGTRDTAEMQLASERTDHDRESHTGSTTNAPSGWKDGTLSASPSTPGFRTLAEAGEPQSHPGASPQPQRAVGLDQAPRVRHAVVRVERARAVVDVRLDKVPVELPIEGRMHSPTETELAGLVLGWDLAVEHGAVAVTLLVRDFYARHYFDGRFKVGRPWNAYHLDALVARLEESDGPIWVLDTLDCPRDRGMHEPRPWGLEARSRPPTEAL